MMILYYVHDPMCSWCWGFRPVWQKIQASLPTDFQITYLLGGLVPDSNDPMPKAMQNDISGHWNKIQQHIPGTKFNFDFWDLCQPRRSTYPACRAIIAARNQKPEIEKTMIEVIQVAYYLNAENPSDNKTLINLAMQNGLNEIKFTHDLDSNETQQQLENEIRFSQEIGAKGFPSMILEKDNTYHVVPLNYNDSDATIDFIKNFL